ncbi:interleukin-12 receptor subunit beta-2 [Triplophysa dalaica]|uniref:interleukin-12 receptor subunit beta-2 n=1 Tax=Triplophysa dalaica TaxID=1582913 RepID=UPI0024DF35E9|nr:interleukin-12 receptor subunit beta-2 [Triplophysa dalaica]XP_056606600.1 interleukin-12 receptor subunit beta-2 [Triplophysa dalaica]XP_056606601.1 interleukin-12 receptor subunit beta-2 [Triplophysa dalaica]
MSPECVWLMLVFLLILAAGAHGNPVCTARSNMGKEVLVGSDLTVSCFFNKICSKIIFRDGEQIKHDQSPDLNVVSVNVKNLTKLSIFTCKCNKDPEPCGIDIAPGYPPDIPQNLTCIRKTESGNVTCTWKIGRDTKVPTTCQLWVLGGPPQFYRSVMNSSRFCFATFPIIGSMSQLTLRLNVSNGLGSNASGPHNFILSNIVKPSRPNISHVECLSRRCHLHTDNHSMNLVEVKYRVKHVIWESLQINAGRSLNILSLRPYTKYEFQIRRKINHTVGLWSEWSQAKEAETQEEAPDKPLDVWYIQEPKSETCFRIFWKKLSKSEAKGKIRRYNISVQTQKKMNSTTVAPNITSRIICCHLCSVSVSATNSKGQSPAKFIELRSPGFVLGVVSRILSNESIALFWPMLAITGKRTEYVVHWYPVGAKEKLQWIRVVDTTANITDLQPKKCYQCAVTALRSSGPVMASIEGISTQQSVPEQGPGLELILKESESLQVKWSKIPQSKIRGCLRKYSIYLQDNSKNIKHYSVENTKKQYTIGGLSPGQCYKLWVTAWTVAGEGPRGFYLSVCTPTDYEKLISQVILGGGLVLLIGLMLLCICQLSSFRKRCFRCCQCLQPTVIPDPANSKCAKEYAIEQFDYHQCDSSMSEEPDIVEVEEVPYPSSVICTYTKSFSQESSSSGGTQITRSTDITEDYICTHGAISGGEEEEEDEEDRLLDEFEFLPCSSRLLELLVIPGERLTLDLVKTNCCEYLDGT